MGQNQVIVLSQLVEDRPGGTGGTDGLHTGNVGEQSQAADDVVLVDKGFHQHISMDHTHMGQVFLHVADSVGEDPARKGSVQNLTVEGVAIHLGLGGHGGRLSGGFGGRFRSGSLGSSRCGGGLGFGGFTCTAAAQQQRQRQGQGKHFLHSWFSFPYFFV